jgi:hypothetical protein
MVHSRLNEQIETALDTLDALYFFLQSVPENAERLDWIRQNFKRAARSDRYVFREQLIAEIKSLREKSGATASNGDFVNFFRKAQESGAKSHIFIPKWEIDQSWFTNFAAVIVRWPHVKDHAMLIYDPQDGKVRNQVFELEGALFRDAAFLVEQARKCHKGIVDFRRRAREDQFLLHTYLRTGATVVFHYLEAYLNGLAFDCLVRHHDMLSEADHDLLLEWDRKKARQAFVSFEKKLFKYPLIFGNCLKLKVDLSACKAAHFLASDGKELRDALTHPSPHLDRADRTFRKITLVTTVSFDALEAIFEAAKEYTLTIERALFGLPEETVPWLFPRVAKLNDT